MDCGNKEVIAKLVKAIQAHNTSPSSANAKIARDLADEVYDHISA
jgi:cytochrome c-type biogenesis protein CcmH/NrfF